MTPPLGADTAPNLTAATDANAEDIQESSNSPPEEMMTVDIDVPVGIDESERTPSTAPPTPAAVHKAQTTDTHHTPHAEGKDAPVRSQDADLGFEDGIAHPSVGEMDREITSGSPKPTKKLRADKDRRLHRERTRSKTRQNLAPRL
jgi:hypothetical protein